MNPKMKMLATTFGLLAGLAASTGVALAADERIVQGWGGTGGGSMTFFSKNHDNPIERAGELAFVYGGSATAQGDIMFLRYDGTKWTEKMSVDENGVFRINVGRDVGCNGCKLAVNGSILATEVRVKTYDTWPDYVFAPSYELQPLAEVEQFISENGHLPDMPSAAEAERDGVELGELNAKLLKKIEELTLHMIDMKKENEELREMVLGLQGQEATSGQ